FDTSGNLIGRFASQGTLNSPHGIALAPANFGAFSNALLVGNFGDGRINAFDLKTGKFLGQLADAAGRPLTNVGLWGMTFGNGAGGTRTNTLYFAAGINGENDGLFASISLANPNDRDGDVDRDRGRASPEGKGRDLDVGRGDRDGDRSPGAASRAEEAADLVFGLPGREGGPLQEPGKRARFEQAVLPHLDAAYNLARWLTRNEHDAQDVVQEAYLRAFRSFDRFRGGDGRAWLLAVVRNTCYTWLK